jgi:hypothetical protein
MKGINRFNLIVEDYKRVYKLCNNHEVGDIVYKDGFVHLNTGIKTKVRISKFESMFKTLESRYLTKINKKDLEE